jgi:hypothetical protein
MNAARHASTSEREKKDGKLLCTQADVSAGVYGPGWEQNVSPAWK